MLSLDITLLTYDLSIFFISARGDKCSGHSRQQGLAEAQFLSASHGKFSEGK